LKNGDFEKHINLAAYNTITANLNYEEKVKNQCRWNQSQLDEYKREVDNMRQNTKQKSSY
jgi:hypothetical protein